jgi:hypothetical protein
MPGNPSGPVRFNRSIGSKGLVSFTDVLEERGKRVETLKENQTRLV